MIPLVIDLLVGGLIGYGFAREPSAWWLIVAAFWLAEVASDVRELRRR